MEIRGYPECFAPDGNRWREVKRRSPVVNGIFYPDNPEVLRAKLASWGLVEGSDQGICCAQAILAPHGAWDLTGSIAASAFTAAREGVGNSERNISRVFLLGPLHHSGEEGIYLSESASFETPLGDLQVDLRLNQELASSSSSIRVYDIPHLSEHSLEVLLPLVKYCFPGVKIVPILMEGRKPAIISNLAGTLRTVLKNYIKESLIIISSNISQDPDTARALSMAHKFRGLLENTDPRAFLAELASGRISACGAALMGALLESGLLSGSRFKALLPLTGGTDEDGSSVYYDAFVCRYT